MPAENGYKMQMKKFEIQSRLSNVLSKFGTMYQGTLNKKPTPTSKVPHIRINVRRNTVLLFDLPPWSKFL
jgi:hypothetical protein